MEASKGVLLKPKIYRVISKRAKEIIGLLTLAIFLTLIENRIPSSVSIFLNRRTIIALAVLLLCSIVCHMIYYICLYILECILLNLWRV